MNTTNYFPQPDYPILTTSSVNESVSASEGLSDSSANQSAYHIHDYILQTSKQFSTSNYIKDPSESSNTSMAYNITPEAKEVQVGVSLTKPIIGDATVPVDVQHYYDPLSSNYYAPSIQPQVPIPVQPQAPVPVQPQPQLQIQPQPQPQTQPSSFLSNSDLPQATLSTIPPQYYNVQNSAMNYSQNLEDSTLADPLYEKHIAPRRLLSKSCIKKFVISICVFYAISIAITFALVFGIDP